MLTQPPFGIIPAMVTPLTTGDEVNVRALRRLTSYLIEGGSHAVFSTGSQGEFWAFSADEKQQIWETVVEETAGRVPVYAGTAAVTTREAIALTRRAERAGVSAVSVLTPYFISPSDKQLFDHYRAIAECSSLPVLLYTNPARTGVKVSVDLVVRLAQVPNIVGIKDSSGDLELTAEYIRAAPKSFSVLMGRDTLIHAALLYGGEGRHCRHGQRQAEPRGRSTIGLSPETWRVAPGPARWLRCAWPSAGAPSRWSSRKPST
jgi:4-hydroxy-tetrahydrodipicolinate synthase